MLLIDKRRRRPLRASIEWIPFVVDETGDVYLSPAAPPERYGVSIASASFDERRALREHGLFLPRGQALAFEDRQGKRHGAAVELVCFVTCTCGNLETCAVADVEPSQSASERVRLIGGHPAELRRLWLFGSGKVPGLAALVGCERRAEA